MLHMTTKTCFVNMIFDPTKPHNTLPDLPPAHDVETKKILRACIGARAALASLKEAGSLIPNQSVLINTIPLREAQASSEIENIVTTANELFAHASAQESLTAPATKEAFQYHLALYEGFLSLSQKPLSTATATAVCSKIKNVDMAIRATTGTQLKNDLTGEVIYTPPVGQDFLKDKMSDWERFVHHQSDIDPLIRMAIAHYQFEAIHPFADGNGRTGRILNILFLVKEELLTLPVLYLSRHIVRNKQAYYSSLQNVTQNEDWETFILYMLEAIEETAIWTTQKIKAICALIDETDRHIQTHLPSIHSRELVDAIFNTPYSTITNLVERNVAKRATASKYLNALEEIKVMMMFKRGHTKIFAHRKYVELLISDENSFESFE